MEHSVPQEPRKDKLEMLGSGAPTQETTEQMNVPEADTSLQSTTVVDAVQAPELAPFPDSTTPDRRGRRGLMIGLVSGAAALAGAVGLMMGGSSEDKPSSEVPTVSADDPDWMTDSTSDTTDTTLEASFDSTEAVAGRGNIDPRRLELGSDPITATRPNGQVIHVPRLDMSTPESTANTALALVSCYMTTGEAQCLDAFSLHDEVQKGLSIRRRNDIVPMLSHPINKHLQVIVFDAPEDPAVFEKTTLSGGIQAIQLKSGTLYYGVLVNEVWQAGELYSPKLMTHKFSQLSFALPPRNAQDKNLLGYTFQLEPLVK